MAAAPPSGARARNPAFVPRTRRRGARSAARCGDDLCGADLRSARIRHTSRSGPTRAAVRCRHARRRRRRGGAAAQRFRGRTAYMERARRHPIHLCRAGRAARPPRRRAATLRRPDGTRRAACPRRLHGRTGGDRTDRAAWAHRVPRVHRRAPAGKRPCVAPRRRTARHAAADGGFARARDGSRARRCATAQPDRPVERGDLLADPAIRFAAPDDPRASPSRRVRVPISRRNRDGCRSRRPAAHESDSVRPDRVMPT